MIVVGIDRVVVGVGVGVGVSVVVGVVVSVGRIVLMWNGGDGLCLMNASVLN